MSMPPDATCPASNTLNSGRQESQDEIQSISNSAIASMVWHRAGLGTTFLHKCELGTCYRARTCCWIMTDVAFEGKATHVHETPLLCVVLLLVTLSSCINTSMKRCLTSCEKGHLHIGNQQSMLTG